MKLRSKGLAVLGIALLATSAVLGALLVHDGEDRTTSLAGAAPGDSVEVKGQPQPFFPTDLARWAALRPLLANHTYELAADDGVVALLTSDAPMPADVVLAQGLVQFSGPHPTAPDMRLVLVRVADWRQPLLFD